MQGHGSVLFFQPQTASPSERLFAAAHREREQRIAEAARRLVVEVESPAIAFSPGPLPDPETPEQWAERQKKIFAIKEPWFSIVDEIDPPPDEIRKPKIEEIQREVCNHYGVERSDVFSFRRTANIVRPRQVSMYLAKKLTGRSLPEIGRRTGNRDHTTVLHAVRKIERLISIDLELAEVVEGIRKTLMGDEA